jgi:FlaA1/EpsC-like NDP-sugar epimerase
MFKKTALTRTLFFMAADILLVVLAVWSSFLLRFDGAIPDNFLPQFEMALVLSLVFTIPIFYFFGLYSFSWSYVSTRELVTLIVASSFSFLFAGAAVFLSRDYPSFKGFPRSTLFIAYILIIFFTAGIRFAKRVYLQFFKKEKYSSEKERILIVGAGDAGEQILRNIQSSESHYLPVGFIDDNASKKGSFIHGVKVLGKLDEMPKIARDHSVDSIIVAFPSARIDIVKKAVRQGRKAGVEKIKVLPSLSEIVNDQVSLADMRDFKIEDLLGRPSLRNDDSVRSFVRDKVILITGAAGSIGSEISRQIAKAEPSMLILLDQDETGIFNIQKDVKEITSRFFPVIADICDEGKIRRVFEKFKPNLVFHAAAYKHVSLMESEPDEAVKNNILGTKIVAQAALDFSADKFIFISTDKAVNPTSVMGATKRFGEMVCQVLNQKGATQFVSVRFGNVLGSRGSVIPIFKDQIKKGGPVKVTHEDMNRYFMIIPEAVSLVLRAALLGRGGEVLVLDMGDPVRILDLANEMIRLSGFEPDKDIPVVFTGSRQGEKITEEFLAAEERITATHNKDIYVIKPSGVQEQKIMTDLDVLSSAVNGRNKDKIIAVLKETAQLK